MKKSFPSKNELLLITLLSALYFLYQFLLSRIWPDSFRIPWHYWQLLDKEALLNNPLDSLILLHNQPPLLNTILVLILKIADWTAFTPIQIGNLFFVVIGWATSLLIFWIVKIYTQRISFGIFAFVLFLLNPATIYYSNLFFYPFLLSFLLTALTASIQKYLYAETPSVPYPLTLVVLLLASIVNMRSLFHPIWAIMIFFLVVIGRSIQIRDKGIVQIRQTIILGTILAILIFLWPLKNYLIFGQFTSSTLTGFNLTRRTEVESKTIQSFWKEGKISPDAESGLRDFQSNHPQLNTAVLAQVTKKGTTKNWNHFQIMLENPDLVEAGIKYRFNNPKLWGKTALSHYARWSQPSFVESYNREIIGPEHVLYQKSAQVINDTVFKDLRPKLKRIGPGVNIWILEHIIEEPNERVAFSVFGLVIFPILLISSILKLFQDIRRKLLSQAVIITTLLITVLWVLLIPCLTDGFEGNRMRFAVYPYLTFLWVFAGMNVRSSVKDN